MPRLSIIIPFQNDDSRLETTLISVLENRPDDCEVIVAHDGSYADEYQIGDEARLLQFSNCCTAEMLNAAVRESLGDIVAVVMDGNRVQDGWSDDAIRLLEDPSVASVAVGATRSKSRFAGITSVTRCTASTIMKGAVDHALGNVPYAGPSLQAGFYRRSTLLAMGGWNERLDISTADVELAWLMQTLGLSCECVARAYVELSDTPHRRSQTALRQLAELCVAYGITGSGLIAATTGWLAAVLATGVSGASAWSAGLMGGAVTRSAIARLKLAQRELADSDPAGQILSFPSAQQSRSLPKAA